MWIEKADVFIVIGSASDDQIMHHTVDVLKDLGVSHSYNVVSAHRTPERLYEFARNAERLGIKVIIAGAGGAAHLPGMIASLTKLPVLGVPIDNTPLNGVDSLYSISQMPKGIPVATFAIGKSGAINAALFATSIIALHDQKVKEALNAWREKQTNDVPYKVN